MNGYLISTGDRPGLAARLFEAAAARGVNVFPAFGLSDGNVGLILVGSDDEAGLQGVDHRRRADVDRPWRWS